MMQERWFPAPESTKVLGRFIDVEVVDPIASEKAKKQVVKRVPALQSKIVGNSVDISTQRVKEFNANELRARFPGAWEHYEASKATPASAPVIEQTIPGTPLTDCDFISNDRISWLHLQGIQTVEQLAELSDSIVQGLGRDAAKWRKHAKEFLKRT